MNWTELKKPETYTGYWNRKLVADGGFQITRIPYRGGFRYSVWRGSELIGCALTLDAAKAMCFAGELRQYP